MDAKLIESFKYISNPISLGALACVVITGYFISRNVSDRKKLKINPRAYVKTAERLDMDLRTVPEDRRAEIIIKALNNRIVRQIILAVSLLIGASLIVTMFFKSAEKHTLKESTIDTWKEYQNVLVNSEREILKQQNASLFFKSQYNMDLSNRLLKISLNECNSDLSKHIQGHANVARELSLLIPDSGRINQEELYYYNKRVSEIESDISILLANEEKVSKNLQNTYGETFPIIHKNSGLL